MFGSLEPLGLGTTSFCAVRNLGTFFILRYALTRKLLYERGAEPLYRVAFARREASGVPPCSDFGQPFGRFSSGIWRVSGRCLDVSSQLGRS